MLVIDTGCATARTKASGDAVTNCLGRLTGHCPDRKASVAHRPFLIDAGDAAFASPPASTLP